MPNCQQVFKIKLKVFYHPKILNISILAAPVISFCRYFYRYNCAVHGGLDGN